MNVKKWSSELRFAAGVIVAWFISIGVSFFFSAGASMLPINLFVFSVVLMLFGGALGLAAFWLRTLKGGDWLVGTTVISGSGLVGLSLLAPVGLSYFPDLHSTLELGAMLFQVGTWAVLGIYAFWVVRQAPAQQ